MSESSFPFGGTAVAEPPTLPGSIDEPEKDRRRGVLLAALAVLVVAAVAGYFVLFSGGGSSSTDATAPIAPHHAATAPRATAPAKAKVVPPVYTAVTGRDPFKPLYVAPTAAPSASVSPGPSTAPVAPVPSTQPSATTSASAAPVTPQWVELDSQNGTTSATMRVAYSNASTRVFQNVPAPKLGSRTVFAQYFALLAIHDGYVTVQFGDGKPFDLKQGFASRHFVA